MLTFFACIYTSALIGAQVSDHVFLLMTDAAVEMYVLTVYDLRFLLFIFNSQRFSHRFPFRMFSHNGSLQLGADVGVALGPLGRALEADFGAAPGSMAPIYTYSLSKGLYAGVSLDGKVIITRHNVNEKFYGRKVSGIEILQGAIPTPPAAQPLYDALTRCHVYTTGERPSRPFTARASLSTESYEYGELMPPAEGDQHSYAGMSEVTTPSEFDGQS
jgi:lipid-binding SYLF domain-containing protein